MSPAIVADVVDLVSDNERSRDSLLAAIADGQDSTQRLLNNGEVVICENLCSNMPHMKAIRLDSAVLCLDEAGVSSTCKEPPSSPLPKPSGVMAPPPSPECTGVMAPPSSPLAGVKKRRRCRRFMTQQDSPPKKLRETDHEVRKTRMETLCLDIPDSPESVDLSIPGLTTPRARPSVSRMSNDWKDSDDAMKIPDSPDSVDLSIPGLTSPRIRPSKAASGTSSSNSWKGPLCSICAEPPAQSPLLVCGNCKVTLHAICADADPPFDRWLCVACTMRRVDGSRLPSVDPIRHFDLESSAPKEQRCKTSTHVPTLAPASVRHESREEVLKSPLVRARHPVLNQARAETVLDLQKAPSKAPSKASSKAPSKAPSKVKTETPQATWNKKRRNAPDKTATKEKKRANSSAKAKASPSTKETPGARDAKAQLQMAGEGAVKADLQRAGIVTATAQLRRVLHTMPKTQAVRAQADPPSGPYVPPPRPQSLKERLAAAALAKKRSSSNSPFLARQATASESASTTVSMTACMPNLSMRRDRMRILGRPMMPERKFNIRDLRVADLVPDGSAEREEARRNAWFLENKDSLYRNESSYVDDGADDYFASTSTAWEGIGTLGYFE